ncbi:MAG: hypothetical protein ACXWZR_13730 [Mycobacterium sp.]
MTAAPTLFRARSVITMEPDTAPGKLANFTVLAQDPYTVAPEQLNRIDVLGSVYAGRWFPAQR